ncbi:MAG: rhodanese-like domain-containing protein [Desulfobacterales bacterium]|nr:MAG: rhodanese-like domain-containing protein [Desulfobacterales bacterium]
MQWNIIIKEMIFLLGIAIISAFTANFFSPAGIALVGQWDESLDAITAAAKSDVFNGELEIKHVKIAKQIYDSNKAVFVDARSLEDFADGHIKGAESLPLDQFDNLIEVFKEKYPAETFIVTYCSGRTCNDSHRLEQLLFDNGYLNVSVFIDGYPGWKMEGYPIE